MPKLDTKGTRRALSLGAAVREYLEDWSAGVLRWHWNRQARLDQAHIGSYCIMREAMHRLDFPGPGYLRVEIKTRSNASREMLPAAAATCALSGLVSYEVDNNLKAAQASRVSTHACRSSEAEHPPQTCGDCC